MFIQGWVIPEGLDLGSMHSPACFMCFLQTWLMKDLALPSAMGWKLSSPCPLHISPAQNLEANAFCGLKVVIPTNSDDLKNSMV